jgi:predicted metal-dependent hydrolase
MTKIPIFGKTVRIQEKPSRYNRVELKGGILFVNKGEKSGDGIIEEYLAALLHSELDKIFLKIIDEEKVEVFGNLDFKVVKKIDGKSERIAKLKGNKILVKLSAVALPKTALKYLIAHEIAHIVTKKHGQRFQGLVKTIHPEFGRAEKLVVEFENALINYPVGGG